MYGVACFHLITTVKLPQSRESLQPPLPGSRYFADEFIGACSNNWRNHGLWRRNRKGSSIFCDTVCGTRGGSCWGLGISVGNVAGYFLRRTSFLSIEQISSPYNHTQSHHNTGS